MEEEDLSTNSAASLHGDGGATMADELQAILDAGYEDYQNSKKTVIRAAACAYLLYEKAASDHADELAKKWLKDRYADRNEEITKFNDAQEQRRKDGEFGNITNADFNEKHHRIEIVVSDDLKEATRAVVRLMFKLDAPRNKSHVSRQATAVRWIKVRFAGAKTPTVDEIVAAFTAGFDETIDLQSVVENGGVKKTRNTKTDPDKPQENAAKPASDGRTSVKVQVKLPQGQTALPEGRCTMVAQCSAGLIEIVSIKPIDEDGDSEDTAPSASSPTIPMKVAPPTQPAPAPEEVPA